MATSAGAGADEAARPSNVDFPMLPPEVYEMEEAEAAVSRASSGGGQALPEDLAARFSASLGADLGAVRIHTGSESASAARAVGAKAYALGQDIHFAAGQYDPASAAGQHLLAHEVAHTVQQAGGTETRQNKLEVSAPGDAHEVEADRAASAMVSGQPTTITTSTHGGVSRFWDGVSEAWGAVRSFFEIGSEGDIEVQRAKQDLEISQQQLAKAQQAAKDAKSRQDQAKAALEVAKQHHRQVGADGASGIPGTEANGRLAEAEKRVQAAEQALEVANRAAERTERELKDAEENERTMNGQLTLARARAEERYQAQKAREQAPVSAAELIGGE